MLTQTSFIKIFTSDPELIRAVLEIEGVLSCGRLVHTATASPVHCLAMVSPGYDCEVVLRELNKIPVEALVVRDGRNFT